RVEVPRVRRPVPRAPPQYSANLTHRDGAPLCTLCTDSAVSPQPTQTAFSDAPLGELQRERAGKADHRMLRRTVSRVPWDAEASQHRRHIDDAAAIMEERHCLSGDEEHPPQIRIEDPPPARGVGFMYRCTAA